MTPMTKPASPLALVATLTVALIAGMAAAPAGAEELPTFRITFTDRTIEPPVLEVPAGTAFKLEIHNDSKMAAEFESDQMHKEKILGIGVRSFVVIRDLEPGEYTFFNDFKPDIAPGRLIAR
jgi:hypothetical protein